MESWSNYKAGCNCDTVDTGWGWVNLVMAVHIIITLSKLYTLVGLSTIGETVGLTLQKDDAVFKHWVIKLLHI